MVLLHQRPLGGDDVVWLAVLVDEPGVGLDPLPPVILAEKPEDGEAALARLNHWNHMEENLNLLMLAFFICLGFLIRGEIHACRRKCSIYVRGSVTARFRPAPSLLPETVIRLNGEVCVGFHNLRDYRSSGDGPVNSAEP